MGRKVMSLLTAVALLAPLTSLHAVPTPDARHSAPKKKKVTIETAAADPLRSIPLGGFTPSLVDPSRAAGIRPQAASERIFRFTPSGKSGDRKALTLGLTARSTVPEATARAEARPTQTAYNIGASVGWLGFSLIGGYSRMETAYGPRREGVDLGLSYRGRNWRTTLLAVSETPTATALTLDPALDKRTSLELGGAYSLSSRLSLSAGARYQLITPIDPRFQPERDPSVFVGTAFTF